MKKLYTIKEVREILGIAKQTVYNWNKQGILPFVRINGKPRIEESALENLVKHEAESRKGE